MSGKSEAWDNVRDAIQDIKNLGSGEDISDMADGLRKKVDEIHPPKAGKTIQKWADQAMFRAEPIDATEGPRVYLLSMTPDPLGSIAAACKMYKGEVVRDLSEVTDDERIEYFEQVQKTKLQAPFEFVQFHFMIEGVTRAFTHQMVRQRTAVYAQESLRFAVKEDMPVGLPPSLAGTTGYLHDPTAEQEDFDRASDNERDRLIWEQGLDKIKAAYKALVENGMPAEDARGLLPTNVLTRLHYSTNLRALLDHAGNRLCTQAQAEWRIVFARIVEAIRNAEVTLPIGPVASVHMADKLSEMFRPVCYATGKCEFMANFDRHCDIRERVQAHAAKNEPSSQWVDIAPVEWMIDGAARKK